MNAETAPDGAKLPPGVRLISWQPKDPPVRLSDCETVTDTDLFIQTTLRQLSAHLQGGTWLAGNWGQAGLLSRLAAVGVVVALDAGGEQ